MVHWKPTTSMYIASFSVLCLVLAVSLQRLSRTNVPTADVPLDFMGSVEKYGYKAEWHNVTTPDGYILSLFRIPPNPKNVNKVNYPPIFLQHGLTLAADCFVFFGPDISLALILSDAGYDVWLGNFRGNTYSRRHRTLAPDDPKFWDFAIDEFATKDLPTMIDYALEHSNSTSMSFMGISLSTTCVLLLLSEKPEYNHKLNSVTLLGPIVKWHTMTTVRRSIIYAVRLMKWLHPTGTFEFFTRNSFLSDAFDSFCAKNDVFLKLCLYPFELMLGPIASFDLEVMKTWTPRLSAGSSFKPLLQYLNIHDNGSLIYYVHDTPQMNLEWYGQMEPPLYNLSNIVAPIVIFRGQSDPMSIDDDIKHFLPHLKNSKKIVYEPIDDITFSHWDFVISKKMKPLVHEKILKIINGFHKNN